MGWSITLSLRTRDSMWAVDVMFFGRVSMIDFISFVLQILHTDRLQCELMKVESIDFPSIRPF